MKRYLGGGIGLFCGVVMVLASLANLVVGLVALFHVFGALAVLAILIFPITMLAYPFVAWIFAGETFYLVLWGILWGTFLLGGIIASLAGKVSGYEE